VVTHPLFAFQWLPALDPGGAVVSYTLRLTGTTLATAPVSLNLTSPVSIYTATFLADGVYSWTVQAHDAAGNGSGFVSPYTFTRQAEYVAQLFLPIIIRTNSNSPCPTTSSAAYELIPVEGPPADHPDYLHGDLNLALRGYSETTAQLGLVNYSGGTDPNGPQLAGLFGPNRLPGFSTVYQVNGWDWSCGTDGCPTGPITDWPVTLAGLATTPGEALHIPERSLEIYGGGYKALVLYAAEQHLTLGYTRRDTVAPGYAVHLEGVCVDPNLLALYQAQVNSAGWRSSNKLPALRNNQPLGTALGSEIQVAIRDKGAFLDPRSAKDWWMGY
jgi:hypothetical protein